MDDPSSRVAYAALSSLSDSGHPDAVLLMAAQLDAKKPVKPLLIKRFLDLYLKRQNNYAQHKEVWPWFAAQKSEGIQDEIFVSPLLAAYSHQNQEIRIEIINALQQMSDQRIDAFLERIKAQETNPEIIQAILWALASRGHVEVFSQLYREAPEIEAYKDHRRWHRDRYVERMGEVFWWDFARLLDSYRILSTATAISDYQIMIKSARNPHSFGFSGMTEKVSALAKGTDPFLNETLSELLAMPESDVDQRSMNIPQQGIPVVLLLISFVLAGVFCLLLLIWLTRILRLKLRVLLFHKTQIKALHKGAVTVQGRVMPSLRGLVEYPTTGEQCVFYTGVEKKFPKHRFYIEDNTGQILVDPADALFLSEQQLLFEGDQVHMFANVITQQHRDKQIKILGHTRSSPSLLQWCLNKVCKSVIGTAPTDGRANIWSVDPANCFCFWDQYGSKPLTSSSDWVLLFILVASTAIWFTVFTATGFALFDEDYAVALSAMLDNGQWPGWLELIQGRWA